MKKVLLVLIALVMIVVDCEDASAKNNLLEELINVVGKTSTSGDFESVREILISFGYQESADEVTFGDNANTYDAIKNTVVIMDGQCLNVISSIR